MCQGYDSANFKIITKYRNALKKIEMSETKTSEGKLSKGKLEKDIF